MWIAGIDTSLTGTGVALIGPYNPTEMETRTFRSKGTQADTIEQRLRRLEGLVADVVKWLNISTFPGLVVIERPSFGATSGSHHDRSGLWWLMVDAMHAEGAHVVEASPTTVKKFATGKGNAGKTEVMAKMIREFPDIEIRNDNEADALTLALMGALAAGRQVGSSTAYRKEAVDKITGWPEWGDL
jgi:crossover junction endodeoxyribonuclease RuvC